MKDHSVSVIRKRRAPLKKGGLVWLTLLVPTLLLASTATAQDQGTSQDFFGKDFANSMLDGVEIENAKGVRRERAPEQAPRQPAVRLPGIPGVRPQRPNGEEQQRPIAPWAKQPLPGGDPTRRGAGLKEQPRELTGRSILAVDLYVNSLNRSHFEKQMENLARFVKQGQVQWIHVGHIGDELNVSEKWKRWIESVNGSIAALPEVPSELKVTQSPTWVMKTKEDQFVFEGFEKVSSLLGTDGDLVLPDEKARETRDEEESRREPEVAQEF
jgi:hypothetical protein